MGRDQDVIILDATMPRPGIPLCTIALGAD
jgi:hypothetical protein